MLRSISILAAALALAGAGPGGRDDADRTQRHQDRVIRSERKDKTDRHEEKRVRVERKVAPPRHSDAVKAATPEIRRRQREENSPNHYYWHTDHGVRYSHYYDGRRHWYGFRRDDRFYWTRLHRDHWWWYDANYNRWVYWYNGLWWWPGPDGVPYAYVDSDYFPYQTVPPVVAAAPVFPPEPAASADFTSPDGKRQVQISPDGAASLYDVSSGSPRYMKTLADGVQRVTFGGGTAAEPLRILLELRSGGFSLYDAEGRELDLMTAAGKATEPPQDVPDALPPIPTSAPGE